jgi:hypothetical protein
MVELDALDDHERKKAEEEREQREEIKKKAKEADECFFLLPSFFLPASPPFSASKLTHVQSSPDSKFTLPFITQFKPTSRTRLKSTGN